MFFKQFYLACLSHASYLIGSDGIAAVIDPQRDIDQYIEEASKENLTIKYIFETHLHADFVSGHKELAEKTGATIIIGNKAGAAFPHLPTRDGDVFLVGSLRLSILETPGHTPESICILAIDTSDENQAPRLFSGDTLFIGDVGRPDLAGLKGYTEQEMAAMMYDSLHSKLSTLGDEVEVYPAHGAGSLCGKNLSNETFSTMGQQKQFNYALKPMPKEDFVDMLTADLSEAPGYFAKDAEINRKGASSLAEIKEPIILEASEVNALLQEKKAIVLDLRTGTEFADGHIPGSINIGLGGQFASWSGIVLGLESELILVASDLEHAHEATLRLARVGIETVKGVLQDGLKGWRRGDLPVVRSTLIKAEELQQKLSKDQSLVVVDVRTPTEYAAGHVPGAINLPLNTLRQHIHEVDSNSAVALICASGYRSFIAEGIFEKASFASLSNVVGGTNAWKEAGLPVEKQTTAATSH